MKRGECKYSEVISPQKLGFLEYFMLPEGDEFEYVYRPGDDSFLMLSVLKNELPTFPKHPAICEIGSGSGILSAHVNKWLGETGNPPSLHFATDISLDACLLSQKYYNQYNLSIMQVCTSLTKSTRLRPDIIICNPPYVLTDPEQMQTQSKYLKRKIKAVTVDKDTKRSNEANLIAYSYMGGPDGLEVTRKLIGHISWETRLYLIVMGDQGLQMLTGEIESGRLVAEGMQAKVEILQFDKKYNEQLYVLKVGFLKK